MSSLAASVASPSVIAVAETAAWNLTSAVSSFVGFIFIASRAVVAPIA